jgi:hypothetical protein
MADLIYIVEGSTGEYSDHQEWPVVAYEEEIDAKLHVAAAEEWARVNSVSTQSDTLLDYHERSDLKNPYDEGMRIDYTGVRYHYYSVEVLPLFMPGVPV